MKQFTFYATALFVLVALTQSTAVAFWTLLGILLVAYAISLVKVEQAGNRYSRSISQFDSLRRR